MRKGPHAPAFGDLLREFRARAGLSQGELAEKAAISEAAVGALERGIRKAPYRHTVERLAAALGLDAEDTARLHTARHVVHGKSAPSVAHNLHAERTSFLGRDADVEFIVRLLQRSRLVTITGSGGVGKTRVAVETARRMHPEVWDEVWFVDLAPLQEGDFIAARIARTVRPPIDNVETIAALTTVLSQRRMLLILDNCEHLIAHAAQTADALLEGCPEMTILATSRELLGVAGEFVYRLPSLKPEPAIDLFVERAEAAAPHICFDTETRGAVATVARRLDGIPLAIELTAAQVPVLGVETLLARLEQEFKLPSGRRDLPARQQTVLATIEWSYNLLTAQERWLLCCASIFSGGFSLAAAEDVCAGDAARSDILPTVLSLANKSLLNVDNAGAAVRYSLLEAVRSFGLERLHDGGRFADVARRHARWVAKLADDVENSSAYLTAQRAAELLPDFDNVRAAVAWSLDSGEEDDRVLASRILTGLFGLWDRAGRRREHRQLVETALERIDETRHPLAVSNLLRDLMIRAGQERLALDLIDRAVTLCERSGDEVALAKLLIVVAQTQVWLGVLAAAEERVQRAWELCLARDLQDSMVFAALLFARSQIRMQQGRIDEARADLAAAEAKALKLGDRYYVICFVYAQRMQVEYAAGNKPLALEFGERMLKSEFAPDGLVEMHALGRVPNLLLQLGEVDRAVELLREWLPQMRGNEAFTHGELEFAALALTLRGEPTAAARLVGRIHSLEERAPFTRSVMRQDAYDLLRASLEQHDNKEIAAAMAAGALLTAEEASDEALAALSR